MPSSRRRPASLQPPAMRRPGGEPSTPPPSGETPPVSSSAGKQLATNLRHQMRYLTQCSEHEALGVRRDSSQQHIEAAFARLIEQFESPPYSSSELATVSMLVRRIIDHLTRAYRRMMQEAASDPDYRDGQPLADPLWLTPDESTVPSSLPKTPVTRKTPKPSAVTSGDPRRRPSSAVQPAAVAKRMTPASERSQQRRSPKVKTSVCLL